jgi:tetratricopeptide (TPR) repeat protein
MRACTQAIREDQSRNLNALYWRGMTYQELGNMDEALADLSAVADSEADFRTQASIAMSMIYFNRKDTQSALDVLIKYKYLYDPNTQRKDDLAVSYNNRCYAFMELGDLKKALEDCTESLKYGSLPDAYRKQQELIKRLKAHETHL